MLCPQVSQSCENLKSLGLLPKAVTETTTEEHIDDVANENVRLDDDQQIVGGTVTAICYRILTSGDPTAVELDEDCHVFCTTIGFWAPLDVVLLEMTRIASGRDVSVRLEQIIRYWCCCTPRILWEDGANESLLSLVEEGVTRLDGQRGRALTNDIVESEKKFKTLLQGSLGSDADSIQSKSRFCTLLTSRCRGSLWTHGRRSHGERITSTPSRCYGRTTIPLPS